MKGKRLGMGIWLARCVTVAALFLMGVAGASAQDLDLGKAVKIGSGKIMVIEFTDPDCGFCRKAEDYFRNRTDVTRYVFFLPLKMHPDAKAKVQYILSAKDQERAFREASSDTFDKKKLSGITVKGIELQKEHEEMARANKIDATPTFIVYGRIIEGFDRKKLEPLLK